MFNRISKLGLMVALAAVSVFAQRMASGAPDPASMVKMRVQRLTTLLTLTEAQQSKATEIFTNAITASESLRTAMDDNQDSFEATVKKNDTSAIETLALAAGSLSGQLMAIRGKAEAAFYALLTSDQQAKYDAMPHGGFGGPGGPGMGRPGIGPANSRHSR